MPSRGLGAGDPVPDAPGGVGDEGPDLVEVEPHPAGSPVPHRSLRAGVVRVAGGWSGDAEGGGVLGAQQFTAGQADDRVSFAAVAAGVVVFGGEPVRLDADGVVVSSRWVVTVLSFACGSPVGGVDVNRTAGRSADAVVGWGGGEGGEGESAPGGCRLREEGKGGRQPGRRGSRGPSPGRPAKDASGLPVFARRSLVRSGAAGCGARH